MKKRNGQSRIFPLCRTNSGIYDTLGFICLIVSVLYILAPVSASAGFKGESYAYNLANFNGVILSQWANVYVDRERKETYVIDSGTRDVRIFDENGMEVYIFGDDGSLGYVADLTVDNEGNILIISKKRGEGTDIVRCNYRGRPIETVKLTGLPPAFAAFSPDRIVHKDGKLYLVQTSGLRIIVTDTNGAYQNGYDIAPMIKVAESKRDENEITGFSVDRDGNMLFTISVTFLAYRLSPDGTIDFFGKAGGAPGSFGVVAGITSDKDGYIYVSDRLRCVVMVFDTNFKFLKEFGYRGNRPENLVVPNDIDTDGDGKVYVSQGGSRGISVFRMQFAND